ncbi:hypothetical protein DVB87_19560 [Tsukamurella tyrosinosolvens]|nr:hypothetical protein DVB87_19560 [Tsukamurella tyrosinosolvens]
MTLTTAEAFRLIGTHFVNAADLLELGKADLAKAHYDRAGELAQELLDSGLFVTDVRVEGPVPPDLAGRRLPHRGHLPLLPMPPIPRGGLTVTAPVVVVDVETTGLHPNVDQIWEVAAIRLFPDGNTLVYRSSSTIAAWRSGCPRSSAPSTTRRSPTSPRSTTPRSDPTSCRCSRAGRTRRPSSSARARGSTPRS